MSLDDNKALARRANAIWASGNTETFEDIFAADYVNHQEPDVEGGVSAKGLEPYKQLLRGYHEAFSKSTNKVLMQIAEGDLVATRWEFTATQTGEYQGLAPTGKEATWTGIQIDRVADGRIVESWVDWDEFRLFQTLGIVK